MGGFVYMLFAVPYTTTVLYQYLDAATLLHELISNSDVAFNLGLGGAATALTPGVQLTYPNNGTGGSAQQATPDFMLDKASFTVEWYGTHPFTAGPDNNNLMQVNYDRDNFDPDVFLHRNAAGNLTLSIEDFNGNTNWTTGAGVVDASEHHWCIQGKDNTVYVYKGGVQVLSAPIDTTLYSGARCRANIVGPHNNYLWWRCSTGNRYTLAGFTPPSNTTPTS